MGGILGRRAWERSNGGLWLPDVRMGPNRMGFCCCEGCQVFDGGTPDTVGVSISGVTDGSCDCDWADGETEVDKANFGHYYDVDGVTIVGCWQTFFYGVLFVEFRYYFGGIRAIFVTAHKAGPEGCQCASPPYYGHTTITWRFYESSATSNFTTGNYTCSLFSVCPTGVCGSIPDITVAV